MIFTEVHLLAGKLILVVAIHSLGGSHANWYHTLPQSGAAQPTQDEDHTSHEQSTKVPFGSLSTKYGRQSTQGYAQGSRLSAD